MIELLQTSSPAEIRETLTFLFEECALDQAPTAEEVAQWRDILQQRGGKFAKVAQMCEDYLQEIA